MQRAAVLAPRGTSGARPGMVQQPQPAGGQLNPVQPIRTSRCSASRVRAAATQSLGSTSSLALGGLVATEEEA
jgi:hypothetical protein